MPLAMCRPSVASLALLTGLLLVGLLVEPVYAQPDGERAAAARAAAQEWLALLEDRDLEESWEEAAVLFRERADRDAWEQAGTRLADSIGAPAARTLTAAQYRDSLRHAAVEGPFVVLTYRTRFAAGRYEELLLMAREEETWRVAGYRLSPLRPSVPPVRSSLPGGSER